MADPLSIFRRNVANVMADHRKASAALLDRLKQLTPQELLRRGPDVWSKLTVDQYREVVAAIAPQVKIPAVREGKVEPHPVANRLRRWWRGRSCLVQSSFLTALVTAIVMVAVIAGFPVLSWSLVPFTLVRSANASNWPLCERLAWTADGCVYIPTIDLNWDWIAWHLQMPTVQLLRINTHLPAGYAPAGSQVVVWRSRGRLMGNLP
ncbi:hypothetical protein OZ411_06625 [Bradyrhizobium sp. Arg237L]|uniref:hypothetical protein n=1 Tax=Bradyrhizobium sp. Arg237L TaxID=3003352 RepID=UPI00249F3AF0|nr:hypothetical protein [Bradyrhizobium sp. Arg237L]MDI4232487.1 hypothetical protein [Bradyrhizobium sp. Arg237L]